MTNKNTRIITKYFSIILLSLLVFSIISLVLLPAKVYAEEIFNYERILDYANSFIENEPRVKIDSTIPIYNLNNELTSYCVNYIDSEGNDYGYIILNKNLNDTRGSIIEVSFGQKSFISSKGEKYYYLDGIEYGQELNNSKIKTNSQVLSKKQARADYITNFNDNSDDIEGYLETINADDIKKDLVCAQYWVSFKPITQTDLRNAGLNKGDENGICGLTTALNVLKYYYDSSISDYSSILPLDNNGQIKLKTAAKRVYSGYVPSGYTYNLPSNSVRKDALNHYIKKYTSLNCSITKYVGIQFWHYFYNDIKKGFIIDVRYNVNSSEGHAVLCVGAVEVSGSHYSGTRYLVVADTWNSYLRLLNFDYYSSLKGMKIKVK